METITKITLQGLYTIELKIAAAAGSDRYILKDVDGLGPPERDISIADGFHQGTRVLTREIEFKIGLNPNYALGERAADLRNEIYGLLTTTADNDVLNIMLHGTEQTYYARGWVKRCVPVPFAKDPEVMITIPTEKAMLFGEEIIFDLGDIERQPNDQYVFNVPNIGNAPAGWRLRTRTSLNTFNFGPLRWPDYGRRMQTSESVLNGDSVTFNTDWDTRSITRHRPNVADLDISGTLTNISSWILLKPGDNWFEQYGTIEHLSYTPTYWGI